MSKIMTDNESLAYNILGAESEARIMNMSNDVLVDNMVKEQAKSKFNQEVSDYVDKLDKHEEYLNKYAEKFKDSMKNLQIMPIYRYALIKPFDENPFQQVKREGRLITDLGGAKPIYKSNETGEWEEEESYIGIALIIEVGPECKYLKVGDVVMYRKESAFPIPFYAQNFQILDEQRVSAVINEGLHERFGIKD